MRQQVVYQLNMELDAKKQHLQDLGRSYHRLKTERGLLTEKIQRAMQAMDEHTDKCSLITARADILLKENKVSKQELLEEEKRRVKTNQARLNERNKTNARLVVQQENVHIMDKNVAHISELSGYIKKADGEMLLMQKNYEVVMEERNYMGIQLIDRNDELCLLHEKVNAQEIILKKADEAMHRKEQKLYHVELEFKDLERQLKNQIKQLPKVAELRNQITEERRQVDAQKVIVEELSARLENPQNLERWHEVGGPIPSQADLKTRNEILKKALVQQNDIVVNKNMMLKEVVSAFTKLQNEGDASKQQRQETSQRILELKHKTEDVNRKLKALVSELALYKVLGDQQLPEQISQMEAELKEARERVSRGECPTAEAALEWNRYCERVRRDATMPDLDEVEDEENLKKEPRENKYTDPQMGTKVPFFLHQPFLPTPAGASMRHFRAPKVKDIVL